MSSSGADRKLALGIQSMRTEILSIDEIPLQKELISLFGENITQYHDLLCEATKSILKPDLEVWDSAGRRGKYLHGYRMKSKSIILDFYFIALENEENGMLKCDFKLPKKLSAKLVKENDKFSYKTKASIDSSVERMKKYRSFYLDLFIDEETFNDVVYIIDLIA